jgi:hypothetical protein
MSGVKQEKWLKCLQFRASALQLSDAKQSKTFSGSLNVCVMNRYYLQMESFGKIKKNTNYSLWVNLYYYSLPESTNQWG